MESQQTKLENFKVEEFGPYRFIGKSVYVRSAASDNNRGSGEILDACWKQSNWVFEELDSLKEYASDEPHNAALITWDAYNPKDVQIYELTVGKTQLLGYCIGRFMKADAPVPAGLDYIDIPVKYVAKGWVKAERYDHNIDAMVQDKMANLDKFKSASWRFMAEIYPKPAETGISDFGYYESLHPLSDSEIAKRKNESVPASPAADMP